MALRMSRLGRSKVESSGLVRWPLLQCFLLLISQNEKISIQQTKPRILDLSRNLVRGMGGLALVIGAECDSPLGSRAWNGR